MNKELLTHCLAFSGYNLILNQDDTDAWGSEADINSGHSAYVAICQLVEFDINEDEVWGGYCNQATSVEIQQYNLKQLIVRYEHWLPSQRYLFLILPVIPSTAGEMGKHAASGVIIGSDDNDFSLIVHEHCHRQGNSILRLR